MNNSIEEILNQYLLILEAQKTGSPLVSNQGQSMDGYSALANYNNVTEVLKNFLEKKE